MKLFLKSGADAIARDVSGYAFSFMAALSQQVGADVAQKKDVIHMLTEATSKALDEENELGLAVRKWLEAIG